MAPALICFAIFVFGPTVAAFGISLLDWNLFSSPTFVGLENYEGLTTDRRLAGIYAVTAAMAVALVLINLTVGLLLAYLLEGRLPRVARAGFRLSYFFPFLISGAAVALIWRFLLHRDFGLVNWSLGLAGIGPIDWLGSSAWAPVSIVLVTSWKLIGFNVLVYVAGLQGIPRELQEAALVDGAGSATVFRRITLPLLTPTVFFLVVINTITAFQIFAEPLVLTEGGPGDASRTIVLYIFNKAFREFNLGYASALAISLFVILAVLTAVQFALQRRWTFYQ